MGQIMRMIAIIAALSALSSRDNRHILSKGSVMHLVDEPQRFEGVEDGGDLIDSLLGLAAETGGEGFGVVADGGQELAEGGHLRGPRVPE